MLADLALQFRLGDFDAGPNPPHFYLFIFNFATIAAVRFNGGFSNDVVAMKTGKYREVFGTYRYRRGVHERPEGKKGRMPDLCRSDALSCGDGERNDSI